MNMVRKSLADALSLLRALAVVPVVVFSIMGNWRLAFAALVLGWATDLFDGKAAKRFGSLSASRGIDADGIADSVLGFGSTLVPVFYAYHVNTVLGLLLTVIYLFTAFFGLEMVMGDAKRPGTPRQRTLIAWNMILSHGVIQIGATPIWFAYMASGAWLAAVTFDVLLLTAVFQMRKLRLWADGRFE